MAKKIIIYIICLLSLFIICNSCSVDNDIYNIEDEKCCNFDENIVEDFFLISEIKTLGILKKSNNYEYYPQYYNKAGSIYYSSVTDWTSGFFPGILWHLYENSNNKYWKNHAEKWTKPIEDVRFKPDSHDLGFMFVPSFGTAFEETGDDHYKNVIIDAANTLLKRYNENVKAIKSWDNTRWEFPVIIDNLINIELLFLAWELTGNERYLQTAINHLNTTAKYHIRENGSVYHIVDFDKNTGEKIDVAAGQGYSKKSTWARGQAWGILGYAIAYSKIKDETYLKIFKKLLKFYVDSLPKDGVPSWDFQIASSEEIDKDSSSSFIVTYALLKMSIAIQDEKLIYHYKSIANEIISNIFKHNYISRNKKHPGITQNSIGHRPRNFQVDVTLVYGDYYFIKTITLMKKLGMEIN